MIETKIQDILIKEFNEKSFSLIEQYLEIHNPIYIDGKLKIDRIKLDEHDGNIIVYLPVENESFHFVVCMDHESFEIIAFDIEAFHRVYFIATSDSLTEDDLKSMTKLKPTLSHNKGDIRLYGNSNYSFSYFEICPNPEPDEFENKLKKLLDYLEQDKEGVIRLIQNADGYLQVASTFHNGNGMIGGPNLDSEDITRLNKMKLSINFDLYVSGNKFKNQ